jgi:hypothetical protein
MMRKLAFYLFWLLPLVNYSQARLRKIVIKAGEVYQLTQSDHLSADTIVIEDSGRIKLNPHRSSNTISARVLIAGQAAIIDGRGANGQSGQKGIAGSSLNGPCRDGTHARSGTRGHDGADGTNLNLYVDEIIVYGTLVIDLAGGNGGDGGDGGEGGGGSAGTLHCNGGTGGLGGDAGSGGNGGHGGTLTFSGADLEDLRSLLGSQIVVNTLGGNFGYRGIPGTGGSPGLGPNGKHGVQGKNGREGGNGMAGNNGSIQFEQQ